jgi:hypothetical protein
MRFGSTITIGVACELHYEQFISLRKPLRAGAPKAIDNKRLSSTILLSTPFF